MTESKREPGTWYENDDRIREVSSDAIVATIEDGGHVEAEIFTAADRKKHARLIAAAPDMLEAGQALLKALSSFADAPSPDLENQRWHFEVIPAERAFNAAIAKAVGRS